MVKQRWADLTARQRTGIAVGSTVQLALIAAVLIDLSRRPADQIRGTKRLWVGLAFVNYIGPVAYFTCGRRCAGTDRATNGPHGG